MLESGTAVVKCEPMSDEEDNNPQLPDFFRNNTVKLFLLYNITKLLSIMSVSQDFDYYNIRYIHILY